MLDDMSTAVIILNYNSLEDTKCLIRSIRFMEHELNPCIIIVDNASNDANELQKNPIEHCEQILLNENNGYAAGNNVGIKRAIELQFNYIFIANSDTEIVQENTMSRMIKAMIENDAYIMGPGILNMRGDSASGAGYVNRFGKVKEIRTVDPVWCQGVVGAFFAIRPDVISNIGYMDEHYFLYLEETAYFYKSYNGGFRSLYYPQIQVLHREGLTTSKVYDYYISRNRFILAEQCLGTKHFTLVLGLFLEYICTDIKQFLACKIGIRNYDYVFRRKMRWKGYRDGVKGICGKQQI